VAAQIVERDRQGRDDAALARAAPMPRQWRRPVARNPIAKPSSCCTPACRGDNDRMADLDAKAALAGITVLERGWLSSNNVLIHAAGSDAGALLVDTGYATHAAMTVELVRQALGGERLARIVNTHLHSDHCGGNAALMRAFGAALIIPPGQADAVRAWDLERLGHDDFGRRERFAVDTTVAPGDSLQAGGRRWQVLAAPGHDPHAVMLFDAAAGVLISADALWENGFGIVFPELFDGEAGFDDVARTLDRIAALPVRLVIPGHGAPFADVAGALWRSRQRLAGFIADPQRHARHAAKVMLKYRLMEIRHEPLAALLAWADTTPLYRRIWARFGQADAASAGGWAEQQLQQLVASRALALADGVVSDA
jgi:glyoxylase-like metal-dependent hydrolase (beta-lactamase superfamily II)